MLLWPTVSVLGFVVVAAFVIALGRGSTARYELERALAHAGGPALAAAGVPGATAARVPAPQPTAASPAPAVQVLEQPPSGRAAHPAGSQLGAPGTASWWLVDAWADDAAARILDGPFADAVDAQWAALTGDCDEPARPVFGVPARDGTVLRRQTAADRAWLAELDAAFERLPDDWDDLLTDTDALTTLLVEVGAALTEAGLPLHDCSARGTGGPTGGVCLTPDAGGVLVSWRAHDRMSVQQVRGAAVDTVVQRTMNGTLVNVLGQLGFAVEQLPMAGCCRVSGMAER